MYCVIKDTNKVIDYNNSLETMKQNAILAGFKDGEYEILTKEEFETINEKVPVPKSQLEILQETVDMLVLDKLGVL